VRISAMVMAGGRGTRMRASKIDTPKPLVRVADTSVLAHNVAALLHHGVRDLHVSTSDPQVTAEAQGACTTQAVAAGGTLTVHVEHSPLGNMGAAGLLHGRCDALMVVFADNLTALDLGAMLRHHAATRPAATLATHVHRVPVPYGALEVTAGQVQRYTEKPRLPVVVSSGVYVWGPAALAWLAGHAPAGASAVVSEMLEAGQRVEAFAHDAPWIDINDATAIDRAEALLEAHPAAFTWTSP